MSPDYPSHPTAPQTAPQTGGVGVLEELHQPELAEPGDHERFAHYVQKEKILESALSGEPVTALCGKVWVPGRDPSRFPVCPTCKEIIAMMRGGGGNKDGGNKDGGDTK